MQGAHIDNQLGEGIEIGNRASNADFRTLNAKFFGLAINTLTGSPLAVERVVEGSGAIYGPVACGGKCALPLLYELWNLDPKSHRSILEALFWIGTKAASDRILELLYPLDVGKAALLVKVLHRGKTLERFSQGLNACPQNESVKYFGSPSSSVQGDAILESAAWEFSAGANQRGSLVSRLRLCTEDDGDPFSLDKHKSWQ